MAKKQIKHIKMPNGEVLDLGLNKSQITNCLLEVPQRIKLELDNGTLTLKAGSQVIVPNGFEDDGVTPKFDYVDIESDLILTSTWGSAGSVYIFFNLDDRAIAMGGTARFSSGATAPTLTNTQWWYDTNTNLIKRYSSASDSGSRISFPIAICTKTESVENSVIAFIDQVFNGLGYIGSTIWVDKGVKGLIPNGRNEDGSLRNIEYSTPSIYTRTSTGFGDSILTLRITDGRIGSDLASNNVYNEHENIFYVQGEAHTDNLYLGYMFASNGKINGIQPKQPFRAVDYSDKAEVSGWSFPSSKYIDLTLNASGSTYIAPADGWFVLMKTSTSARQFIVLLNQSNGLQTQFFSTGADQSAMYIPAKSGQIILCSYSYAGATDRFRFIYAEGSK